MLHAILPLLATIPINTINTGVEQGDENTPPNIPAINAPMYPLFLFCLQGM